MIRFIGYVAVALIIFGAGYTVGLSESEETEDKSE